MPNSFSAKYLLELTLKGKTLLSQIMDSSLEKDIGDHAYISIQSMALNYTCLSLFSIKSVDQLQVHIHALTAQCLVWRQNDGYIELSISTQKKQTTFISGETSYILVAQDDRIVFDIPNGKNSFVLLFLAPRFLLIPYSVRGMSPLMKVYWSLLLQSVDVADPSVAEASCLAFMYHTTQKTNTEKSWPVSYYARVHAIAARIIQNYRIPGIVGFQLKNMRMDRHVFYTLFRQLYDIHPTALCMRIRFYQETVLVQENPQISEVVLAEAIGFTSVSNYRRAKSKYGF